jgi:hypothetical protein
VFGSAPWKKEREKNDLRKKKRREPLDLDWMSYSSHEKSFKIEHMNFGQFFPFFALTRGMGMRWEREHLYLKKKT